jgi:hypothetical protein
MILNILSDMLPCDTVISTIYKSTFCSGCCVQNNIIDSVKIKSLQGGAHDRIDIIAPHIRAARKVAYVIASVAVGIVECR